MDVMLLIWVTNGKGGQRVQCGRVRAKIGQKTKACPQAVLEEGNVSNAALHVIGLYGLDDKISLLEGLGAGKGGTELSHGPGHAVPGNA